VPAKVPWFPVTSEPVGKAQISISASSSVRRLLDGMEISMRHFMSLMSMKHYKEIKAEMK